GITFITPSYTLDTADSGTRLKEAYNNLPSGVNVWVAATNNGSTPQTAARLITSKVAAFTLVPMTAIAGSFAVAQVPLVNGSGTATWEALAANPNAFENFDFPVWFTGNASVNLAGAVDGSLAPNPANGAITASSVSMASN